MGVTIHYSMSINNKENILPVLNALGDFARELGAKEVSEIRHFDKSEIEAITEDKDNEWWWSLPITYVEIPSNGSNYSTSVRVLPTEAYVVRIYPGEGCETAFFGFATYPEVITHKGEKYPTNLEGWSSSSFCKTQYSKDFTFCHKLVISLLRYLDSISSENGMTVDVYDEAGYWEHGDDAVLKKIHHESQIMIAAIAGTLIDSNAGDLLVTSILEDPNFEYIEMEGLESMASRNVGNEIEW